MAQIFPAELFHKIIYDFLLVPQAPRRLLSTEYHLLEDRQVCYYTHRDFQNARLVCRLWNQWLMHNFDYWRYLCVNGVNSLAVAKDAMKRFEGRPFHIRLLREPVYDDDKAFDESDESDSDTDGSSEDEDTSDEYDSADDGDDFDDSGDDFDSSEGTDASDTETLIAEDGVSLEKDDGAKIDESNPCRIICEDAYIEPRQESSELGSWMDQAMSLFAPIIPDCEGIHLHLPTQILHATLKRWAALGAPKLRRCTFHGVDYDGLTKGDLRRYERADNPRALKPPAPPIKSFLQISPLLTSVTIMNYHVPTASHEELGFDLTQLSDFTMVFDRDDGPIIGPMGDDVYTSLIAPALTNGCKSLTLNLNIDDFVVQSQQLRGHRTLDKIALGEGLFNYRPASLKPLEMPHASTENFCFKTLAIYHMMLWLQPHQRVPTKSTVVQFFIEEMPNLEALYLISPNFHIGTSNDEFAMPYIPPTTPLLNLTTLLIDSGNVLVEEVVALIKRTPNLERLAIAAKRSENIYVVPTALGTIEDNDSEIICPKLRRFQILFSVPSEPDEDEDDEEEDENAVDDLTEDVYGAGRALERVREYWAEHGWCVPLEVKFQHHDLFHSRHYEDLM
ncbi:hypothetical protein SISSUDRAFT_1048296 [Sistotremastrum suecicum HHB10207 ss-3]|uniref:F-box domain-containing protein n=1 Tax=Sistotremastrum suecicum HHB10207 ss-3 TaxID=1314776 RepID=A0A166CKN2_9AGAM|nr:hypothetical protein SISSUDRAFT_1048296 [Sistotremastrum suecicum HHB10207 ss-3]